MDEPSSYRLPAFDAASIAAGTTLLIVALPFVRFAYQDRAAHL